MSANTLQEIFTELRNRLKNATQVNGYTFNLGETVYDTPQNLTVDQLPCVVIIIGEVKSTTKVTNNLKCGFEVDVMVNAHCLKPELEVGVPEKTDTEVALDLMFDVQKALLSGGVVLKQNLDNVKIEDVVSSIAQTKQDGLPVISVGVLLRVVYNQIFK